MGTILIFSTLNDDHSRKVAEEIVKIGGSNKTPLILDTAGFSNRLSIEAVYSAETKFRINFPDGSLLELGDVQSFWWRRPQPVVPSPLVRDMTSRCCTYTDG